MSRILCPNCGTENDDPQGARVSSAFCPTPGSGFGAAGEGYFRLSAFNSLANVQEALQRIRGVL